MIYNAWGVAFLLRNLVIVKTDEIPWEEIPVTLTLIAFARPTQYLCWSFFVKIISSGIDKFCLEKRIE
jgi:hypothetical protein